MPIPLNITAYQIVQAIDQALSQGVPKRRQSNDYDLLFEGKRLPPKYIISLANRYANGQELHPTDFSGGLSPGQACYFLKKRGFEIVTKAGEKIWSLGSQQFEASSSNVYPFTRGQTYTRQDVYEIVGVPDSQQGGDWLNGYHWHNGDCFIFANVGVPGRTGHDYQNQWEGEILKWYGRTRSRLTHESIQRMLDFNRRVYVFYRNEDRAPFTFAGLGKPLEVLDTTPVTIWWQFENSAAYHQWPQEEHDEAVLTEGAVTTIRVNAYERNPKARKNCLDYYGTTCYVCNFDFGNFYGQFADAYIQVHHLVKISAIKAEYVVDPIKDLRPLCPNCHAAVHLVDPPMDVEELKDRLRWGKANGDSTQ